jgi:hypothetical protein
MFLYVYMSTTVSQRVCINSRVSAKTAAIRCCAGFHNEGERTKCLSLKYIYTYIYLCYTYVYKHFNQDYDYDGVGNDDGDDDV